MSAHNSSGIVDQESDAQLQTRQRTSIKRFRGAGGVGSKSLPEEALFGCQHDSAYLYSESPCH